MKAQVAAAVLLACLLVSVVCSGASKSPSSFTEVSFPLEHALGGAGWSAAGAFTARAYFDRSGSGAVRLSHVKLERAVLGEDQKLALSALLRDDGLYRVRVPSNALAAADAVAAGNWVAAFLPARCWASLASAKPMAESFILQSDDAGNVLTVELSPPGGSCAPVARAPPVPASFAPTVTVRLPKEAPTLAGLALSAFNADAAEVVEDGPDPGSTAGAAGGGSAPVERTFFQKYGLAIGLLVFNLAMQSLGVGGGAGRASGGEAATVTQSRPAAAVPAVTGGEGAAK